MFLKQKPPLNYVAMTIDGTKYYDSVGFVCDSLLLHVTLTVTFQG